jgi:hypothetical protein
MGPLKRAPSRCPIQRYIDLTKLPEKFAGIVSNGPTLLLSAEGGRKRGNQPT